MRVFVLRFDSQEWPEYNRTCGVYTTKEDAVQAMHRIIYADWQNHKKARSRPMQDQLYYHIEEFDVFSSETE
jgi:hypothetical protein